MADQDPAQIAESSRTRPLAAALWMGGAVFSFTLMAIAGREVSVELDTFELLAYRSAIGMAILAVIIALRGEWQAMQLRHPGQHLLRNLVHFTAQNLWFHALVTVPLAQVFALEFTAPLWALLLSPLLLGERLTRPRAMAALLGFAGILLVTRPGSVPVTPGLIAAASCAIGFALNYILTKRLTGVTTTLSILWWMTVMQTTFGLFAAGIDGRIALPSSATMPWVVILGLTGLGAHFCITSALRLAPATLVMPFDFMRLPVIAVIGAILYAEPVGPLFILGAALILGGNLINIRAEGRQPRS